MTESAVWGAISLEQNCPHCSATKIYLFTDGDGVAWCKECGSFLGGSPEPKKETQLVAHVIACPHCKVVDCLEIAGGSEWCNNCGLDPNEENLPSIDIAKLYKGGIRGALERDVPMMRPDREYGAFVRTQCGPNCPFARYCPQSARNLIICFKEEHGTIEETNTMARKKKYKHAGLSKAERKALKKARKRAVVLCSASGWFKKVVSYENPNENREHDPNTGRRSGA